MVTVGGKRINDVDRNSALYKKLQNAHRSLAEKDSTLWGQAAQAEAAIRLNWVDLPLSSQALLPELTALKEKFKEFDHLILCGMGGSSLAPEVIAKSLEKKLFILDSTDPHYISHTKKFDLSKTIVIVSSKSGSTIETSSQRAYFEAEFRSAHLDPSRHMIFVTDPNSPLDQEARTAGFTVINADPHVGGRFSALSAFGLVPAELMGVDPGLLLRQAQKAKQDFLENDQSIIDVTYLLSTAADQYLLYTDEGSPILGLSDWIEQLIAESTGKDGKGRLPIAMRRLARLDHIFSVAFSGDQADLVVKGEIGEHFIFWEWVTALLGVALGVDPFNQPNVTEAKDQTSRLLTQWNNKLPEIHSQITDGNVEIFGDGSTLREALKNLIATMDADGYIAIMAYLDRIDDEKVVELQEILMDKSNRPVSFGWGPRFLHSTGQFHKAGQPNGSFLQITGEVSDNFLIPSRPYDFRTLCAAQSEGDGLALTARKYPLLRFHLLDRRAGIDQIVKAAQSI